MSFCFVFALSNVIGCIAENCMRRSGAKIITTHPYGAKLNFKNEQSPQNHWHPCGVWRPFLLPLPSLHVSPFACSPLSVLLCLFILICRLFLQPILRPPILLLNAWSFVRWVRSFCSVFVAVHLVTFSVAPYPTWMPLDSLTKAFKIEFAL